MKNITAREAKVHFGRLLDSVQREPVTIEKHGRAATWSPDRGDDYLDALRDVLIQLAHNPHLGLPAPEVHPDLYRFPHTSHVIYYRTVPDGIEVARILHQRMEPGRHL